MFGDRLKLTLTLVIGGETFSITSREIEHINVAIAGYGFHAEVGFVVLSATEADEVFPQLSTTTIVKATLSIANGRAEYAQDAAAPLSLMGYVTDRRVREVVGRQAAGEPVVARHYVIRFLDPAQAFWRQHQPIVLYVNTSMQQVIDLHKALGMTITYDWTQLSTALDVLCVGLGGDQDASFYDWVVWYLHENHGVLELDPGTGAYRIGKLKSTGGQSLAIGEETSAEIRVLGPETVRHTTIVNNPSTEAAVPQKTLTNEQAVTGVSVGAFAYTVIAASFDARVQIETDRLAPREHGLEVIYRACPEQLFAPGQIMSLGGNLSSKLYASGKKYRTVEVYLKAQLVTDDEAGPDLTTAAYDMELRTLLELESDPTPRLPPFCPPRYPVLVEGRVLSASGQDADRTFNAVAGENDSLFRYRVNVPLWGLIIVAPFLPMGLTGHFFFPAFKNQRVLCALNFDSARISSFLEWAGKLSKDTQGDQLVLGWNDESETIISHQYQENKPVLCVARRLKSDTETMTISEGAILMVVKEEPSS